MDEIPAMIRESNLYVAADNSRRADVQQLSSDHEAIAPRLRFDLDIDLVGISAVEHLPCPPPAGPHSRQQRLQKTVEQHLDETALLRLLRGSAGCRERRLGDSNSRNGRLIAGFPCRRVPNFLTLSHCLHTLLATRAQVLLHCCLLLLRNHVVHEIDPLLHRNVLHQRSPIHLSLIFRSPAEGPRYSSR